MNVMKYLLVVAVFGFILWSYWATIKDVFSFFAKRKANGQMKRLEADTRSQDALALEHAAKKNKLQDFTHLLATAGDDTLLELVAAKVDSKVFEDYARQNEGDFKAHYLYGEYLLDKAWLARSGAVASKVSAKQVEGFYHYLNLAKDQLFKAKELRPEFIGIYNSLLNLAVGNSDKPMAYALYQEASQLQSDVLDYHVTMLIVLTEKWLGSEAEMFEFARAHSGRVTKGPLKALIPVAHFEAQLFMKADEREAYFAKPEVQREVRDAYLGVANLTPGAGYYERHQYFLALNYFVFIFQAMNDFETARSIYQKIGGFYTNRPWQNLGSDIRATFMKYKQAALKAK